MAMVTTDRQVYSRVVHAGTPPALRGGTMTRTLAMVTLAIASLVASRPANASAKPKIALTAIDGDESGSVGDAVTEALDGEDLTVISQRVVNKAVDKLGLDSEMTEKQAKKLAGEVEADAIVVAKLDK